MKYLGNASFMNCIYMTIDKYKEIIKDIFGSEADVWSDIDGLCYDIKDTGKGVDILSELSKYFECEVTSAHADDCDFTGVWIAYKDANEMQIHIDDFIDKEHQSHYWYGGECATIMYKGYVAKISAIGDVYAEYAPGGEYVTHIKDKNNGGVFYSEFNSYIKNDEELDHLIKSGDLIFDYNNWWECFIVDKNGETHDLMWCLDATFLSDAIEEVKESLDEMIAYIEEENTDDKELTFKIEMLCHDIAVDKSYKDEVFEKFSSLKEAQERMHICAMDEVETLNDDSDTIKYVYDIEVVDENNLYVRAVDCITGAVKHVTDYKVVAYSED